MNRDAELLTKKDFMDMIRIFNEEEVRYMLIGGIAVVTHGFMRYTKDLDLLILPSLENAVRIMRALEKFGAPMHDIAVEDFEKEGTVFQIGVEPVRIDIITATVGITFEDAYRNIEIVEADGLKIPLISIPDLIKNKKAAGRPRDLNDVRHLEVILKRKTQQVQDSKTKGRKVQVVH